MRLKLFGGKEIGPKINPIILQKIYWFLGYNVHFFAVDMFRDPIIGWRKYTTKTMMRMYKNCPVWWWAIPKRNAKYERFDDGCEE